MAKKGNKLKLRAPIFVLSTLLAVTIAATDAAFVYEGFLNTAFQIDTVVSGGEGGDLFTSDYATQDELVEAKLKLIQETVSEGCVLLKNDNKALPLNKSKESKVTVFGRNSTQMIQGISGGASQIKVGRSDTIVQAMSSVGIDVNPTLYKFYEGKTDYSYSFSGQEIQIGEVPVSDYSADVHNSFKDYNDAAIIVITRSKAEGSDFTFNPKDVKDGDGVHYGLQLQQNERDMIALAKENFNKVVVLLNSDYAMEIDELKYDKDIDSILWIGGTGYNGIYGVARLLVGEANPSGGLADIYASSVQSSPAAQNFGDYSYSNVSANMQSNYVIYKEGIYVGYKYYETRYEDSVLNRYNASSNTGTYNSGNEWDYSSEVTYSFGYGLSYTTFNETIKSCEVDFDKRSAKVEVEVENTGAVAGKHIVQLYAQSPYTQYDITNKVEKSAIQLLDFGKTKLLNAGEKETVTLDINLDYLASYDYVNAKTYIMEAGDYYFAIGNGAHDALNNVLAQKGKTVADGMDYDGDETKAVKVNKATDDKTTYSVSSSTGYTITNRLDEADLNYYGDFITYLSRSDWNATWPTSEENFTATDKMIEDLKDGASYTATVATEEDKAKMVYGSTETDYHLSKIVNQDFDSEYWEGILNQLTLKEMSQLVGVVGSGLRAATSINFGGGTMTDGPAGTTLSYTDGKYKNEKAVMFQSEVILASTFNKDLARAQGEIMGNDGLHLKVSALWAPGCNIHRTPMSGRNSEYFSEDGVLTSLIAQAEVEGAAKFGVLLGGKHFCFNDQETNRNGISTFFNEQSAREIYLRGFESPLKSGLGAMSAYNRVGCTYSSAVRGLMTEILRNEWGYKGYVISDAVGSRTLAKYADGPASVYAGLTAFDTNVENTYCGSSASLSETAIISDPVLFESMRTALHYNLYAFAHSNAMNGYAENVIIKEVTPFYQTAIIIADAVIAAALLVCVGYEIFFIIKNKNTEAQDEK